MLNGLTQDAAVKEIAVSHVVGHIRGAKLCYLSQNNSRCLVTPLSTRVLRIFKEMGEDRLDLHVLFEAAGNEPEERARVLDAVDELVREGMLEASSGDFYALTEKGKKQSLRPE